MLVFESYEDGTDTYELAGLVHGDQQLAKLKNNYQSAVKLLVEVYIGGISLQV